MTPSRRRRRRSVTCCPLWLAALAASRHPASAFRAPTSSTFFQQTNSKLRCRYPKPPDTADSTTAYFTALNWRSTQRFHPPAWRVSRSTRCFRWTRCRAAPSEQLLSSGAEDGASSSVRPVPTNGFNTKQPAPSSSTSIVDDDCFLGADGAAYCVVEPSTTTGTQSLQQQSTGTSLFGEDAQQLNSAVVAGTGGASWDKNSAFSLYTMMGLCFLVAVVCALDRVAMSVAIVTMGNVYDYTDTTKGLISSVFSWGYMASMVPSSVLIGVWGPKATMAAGVLAWSAAQMLSPTAASLSLPTLLACRFAMGVGEAVTLPSIQAIVAEWVPQDQRSRWLSLIISGLQVGTVLAYLASPAIISAWNWEGVFLAYGALGLLWLALWIPIVPNAVPNGLRAAVAASTNNFQQQQKKAVEVVNNDDTSSGGLERGVQTVVDTVSGTTATGGAQRSAGVIPQNSSDKFLGNSKNGVLKSEDLTADGVQHGAASLSVETVSVENRAGARDSANTDALRGQGGVVMANSNEVEHDEDKRAGGGGVLEGFRDVPWMQYATNGQIWSITSAHMAHNWGLYVLLAWLPTYFSQEFNLSVGQSSGASVIPWVAGAVTGNVAGWVADALVNKGVLDLRTVRKLFQTLALVGPAACMLALSQGPETSSAASLLFTVTVALGSCSCAGFGSSVQDLKSKHTGVIYGMTSACSAVVGSAGTFLTGVVLDTTDSWAFVFQVTAAVYVIGALIYFVGYRAEPLVLKNVDP